MNWSVFIANNWNKWYRLVIDNATHTTKTCFDSQKYGRNIVPYIAISRSFIKVSKITVICSVCSTEIEWKSNHPFSNTFSCYFSFQMGRVNDNFWKYKDFYKKAQGAGCDAMVLSVYVAKYHQSLLNPVHYNTLLHHNDVIMGAMTSQITSLTIVYSTVYPGSDQRKHQSSASLAFVRGIHRLPVKSPHKGQVASKIFPFDDVIMNTAK